MYLKVLRDKFITWNCLSVRLRYIRHHKHCFSSIGSYYRSPYLDSSSSTSSYSNNYSTPDYESKYEALISRNPDGAGKSRSGKVEPVGSSRASQF